MINDGTDISINYQFKDEIRNKYKSRQTCLEDDDRELEHLEADFGQLTNEFIRYDVQRNQMGSPVKVRSNETHFTCDLILNIQTSTVKTK